MGFFLKDKYFIFLMRVVILPTTIWKFKYLHYYEQIASFEKQIK